MPEISKIVVHWNADGSTNPTTYEAPKVYNVDNGVLVVQVKDTEFMYIPLSNIWHFNVIFKG